jgi:glycosyltransferase involved in cell wall biosynthesis
MNDSRPHLPALSIILPTFDRARFLPAAIDSIRAQSFQDWELIVVDDGSTDESVKILPGLISGLDQPARVVEQENGGAYSARNRGLDLAEGELVAFFDSDDRWRPHHLERCVDALRACPDVDWVYSSSRFVDGETGQIIEPDIFYEDGRPHPFLRLRTRRAGDLHVFDDPRTLRWLIRHGHQCMLQNSVIRRRVFEGRRFPVVHRNEAEDFLMVIRVLALGYKLGYYHDVHVDYCVHAGNSSASAKGISFDRHATTYRNFIKGIEDLIEEDVLRGSEQRELVRKLSREVFWSLGYALMWRHDRRQEAMELFRRGLALDRWNLGFWKTYILAAARTAFTPKRNGGAPSHRTEVPVSS